MPAPRGWGISRKGDQLRQGSAVPGGEHSLGSPETHFQARILRQAGNARAVLAAGDPAPPQRPGRADSFVLSAARSLIFNAVVGERVRQGDWGTLAVGDVANLDGRGSVFPVAPLTPDLPARLAALDLHPTGPMWGAGELMSRGPILALEQRIGAQLPVACQFVIDAGLRQERRSLRLAVRDFTWERDADGVVLRFWLRSGSFATAVLREILGDEVDADDV